MAEITLTEQNFDQEVLDFWATWCGPCRMLAPTIAEIAEELSGKVKVGKVDVDDQPGLAARFGISSIPTVLVFKGGKLASTSVGLRPKAQLLDMLK